jgi:hypothetical protein
MQSLYEVEVPQGIHPGQAFQANVAGQLMLVTCPEGATSGTLIQVAGPNLSLPTVAGVPVNMPLDDEVAAGYPIGGPTTILGPHEVAFVEVDEISPAGWLCLIVGCFACPGLNLLGLCMRERRLVPIHSA